MVLQNLLLIKPKRQNKVTMLIYSKKIAVAPITTHIAVKKVSSKLNVEKIVNQTKEIFIFYKKIF